MKINMNTIILFLAVCLCGCSQRDMGNETGKVADHDSSLEKKIQAATSDSVQFYFEQAQLGIGDAYVKMAQYYRDGTLGKPNLLKAVTMGFMAEEYMAIPNVDALFRDVPDSDATKIAYHALDMLNQVEGKDTLMVKANELIDKGIPEGYVMKAIIAWKKGEEYKAMLLCDKATGNGSTIADVLKDIIQGDTKYGEDISPQTLLKIFSRPSGERSRVK